MSGKTTSYIDAKGVKRTGYIVDGRTYEDESATIPVAKGSIVDAGGRRYVKGVGENGESMLYADYLKRENMKATDYVDSQGLLKIGYVKDGKTYADILATTPVESVYSDYLEKEEQSRKMHAFRFQDLLQSNETRQHGTGTKRDMEIDRMELRVY